MSLNKSTVKTFVLGTRTSMEALVSAIDALPAGPEKDAVIAAELAAHARLNVAARALGEFFDDPEITGTATRRTGGEDKPT